ncbi:MAG: TRAP transporter small permease subunit, partial [Dinoroseobacter sp.]|nr:TRAP transporter small permease subunit [Dinoroseobacter sp.]
MTPFAKLASGIAMAANAAGTFVVIALIAVVNYDIIARGLFNKPFLGAVEVVQFSMVLIVFLQLPDVIRVGRLTRSDGFLSLMRARRPAFGRKLSQA